MRAYMRGHVSALIAQYDAFGHRGNLRRIFRQIPAHFVRMAIGNILEGNRERRAILIQQILGWFAGLQYLARPGWRRARAPWGPRIARKPLGHFLACNPFPRGWTDGLFYREKMRALYRIAPPSIGVDDRILEIGGGRSGMASYLYPGADITTLDIDPSLGADIPETARSRFVCGDARSLPFPDEHFAMVTLFDVLEHIEEDGLAVREALRVTRKGGHVLVSTPAADWHYPYYSAMKRVCPHESELMREWGHVRRGYRPQDLEKLFGGAPESSATFINPVTAFFHDVAFSRLRARWRMLLYAATALPTALAYALHRRSTRGTESAFAWRR
jgi:SAM-dependent methyltransferase